MFLFFEVILPTTRHLASNKVAVFIKVLFHKIKQYLSTEEIMRNHNRVKIIALNIKEYLQLASRPT